MAALLRTRQITWFLALLVGVLALSYSYVSGRHYVKAVAWVEHTLEVERTLESLLAAILDEESSSRGYLVTGDHVFLERVRVDRDTYARGMDAARALTIDNPVQADRVARLERIGREKHDFMQKTVELRDRGATRELNELVASRRGKTLMDDIFVVLDEMRHDERRLFEARSARAASIQARTVGAIAAGVIALLGLLGGSYLMLRRDQANLEQVAEKLAESEERYRVLIENSSELVTLTGPDGRTLFASPSSVVLLGYTPDEMIAQEPFAIVHPDDASLLRERSESRVSETGGTVIYRLRHKSGSYRSFEFHVTRVTDADGVLRHFQASGRDVTERRELEQRLAEQAEELRSLSLRDGLTGLYNRRGFLELSQQHLRVARRDGQRVMLMFADLDGLKAINDRLGHEVGDRAIAETGEILRSTCRSSDVVARLGGDEFVVLAHKLDSASVELLKGRLERAVETLNRIPGREYELSFSIGFATFDPALPVPVESLLAQADLRMYEAKSDRRRKRHDAAAPAASRSSSSSWAPEFSQKTPSAGSS